MALNVDLPLKDVNDFVADRLILSLQHKDADNVIKKIQRVPPAYGSLMYLIHRTSRWAVWHHQFTPTLHPSPF